MTLIDPKVPSGPRTDLGRVVIVGLGYTGLPTALAFAGAGAQVHGFDIDPVRLDRVRALDVDVLERDRSRLQAALASEHFELGDDPEILRDADTVVICVPTPVDEGRAPDLGPLTSACAAVVERAHAGQLLILTSTTYVGCTTDLLVEPLRARGLVAGRDVAVAFSPERIDPGNEEFPSERVPRVVGGATASCSARAGDAIAVAASSVHLVSSPEVAEMAKLVENTFRAVNIALANELASASRTLGVDVLEVIEAAATKPFGFMPFYPGPGAGGHCIPCDPHYLLWTLRGLDQRAPLIEETMARIAARPAEIVRQCVALLQDAGLRQTDSHVHVVGVAYKADVADTRESPALQILSELAALGVQVTYSDPRVPRVLLPTGLELTHVEDPAIAAPDLVVVHTLHRGVDTRWLLDHPRVLDATYRAGIPHAALP